MNRRIGVNLFAVAIAVISMSASVSKASSPWTDTTLWGVNGFVSAVARTGGTLYVGGSFNSVGPNSGGGVSLDLRTAEPTPGYPRVAGVVSAVAPDGNGGWFIGGAFAGVGGQRRSNLAHILPGGGIDAFDPGADGTILALILDGPRLYVGGTFTTVGGASRSNLAVIDAVTGRALDWSADTNAPVDALALSAGRLYVAGSFSLIGGASRNSLAAVDASSGVVSPWNPNVGLGGSPGKVRALALAGDTVYIGGDFANVGSVVRHRLASINVLSAVATDWDPDAEAPLEDETYGDPYVSALAVSGAEIYIGGHFTQVGGRPRGGLAEVDRTTGAVSNLDIVPAGTDVVALIVQGSSLFLSGGFTTIAGQPRHFCAELNLRTGLPTPFAPRPDSPPQVIAACRTSAYIGGPFFSVGPEWRTRHGLAAFDLATGELKDWDLNPDALLIQALTITHGRLFIGGVFTRIGGQSRYCLASVDTLTGEVTDWNPIANGGVGSFAVSGDTLYAGGYFSTMGGQLRGRLASFDLTTGAMTNWNPNADPDVYGLTVSGGIAYVSGFFWQIGGVTRKGIAAVDAVTGAVLPWSPDSDNWCYSTAVAGDTVFVAGYFNRLGGQPRRNLAALDAVTGQALSWSADADNAVVDLAILRDTLFVGGGFADVGGQRRSGLAALDLRTGSVLPWDPNLGGHEWGPGYGEGAATFALADNTLYVGGGFWRVGPDPATCIAAISFGPRPTGPAPVPSRLVLRPLEPNPVHRNAMLHFALPSAMSVSVAVFDVLGRQVASPLDHVVLPAGANEVSLRADGLHDGVYFCQVQAGGMKAQRKFVVTK